MSLIPHSCPGCSLTGGPHFEDCPKRSGIILENTVDLTKNSTMYRPIEGQGVDQSILNSDPRFPAVEHIRKPGDPIFVTGMTTGPKVVDEIHQTIIPSSGTKLVCSSCGKVDWHTLILRRKAGLLEGLCKQEDGSGCWPQSTRRNCSYTYPNQMDCPQLAEYCVALGKERLNPRQVCRDHIGETLNQGPLYQVWPLED